MQSNCSLLSLRGPAISRRFVGPNDDFGHAIDRLSPLDQYVGKVWTRFGLLYSTILDVERMEEALQKALDVYPTLAGRLDPKSVSSGTPFIAHLNAGIGFESIEDCKNDIPQPITTDAWDKLHGLPAGFGLPGDNTPLATARLVRFHRSGKSIIFIKICHIVGDFGSYMQFLRTWSHFAECPDTPLPSELYAQPLNQRLRRMTKLAAYDAATVKQRMDNNRRDGTILGAVRRMILSPFRNQSMVLHAPRLEFQNLKAELRPLIQKAGGDWASTFEVVYGSYLAARAASLSNPRSGGGFKSMIFIANVRDRVPEDPNAFNSTYFGNAVGAIKLDLSGCLDDVDAWRSAGGTPFELVARVVVRLHDELRKNLARGDVLCEDILMCDAAMEHLDAKQFRKFALHGFLAQLAGFMDWTTPSFNEYTSHDPLAPQFGTGKPASHFIPDPKMKNMPGIHTLMPFTEHEDVIPCSMPCSEATRFVQTMEEWQLPFKLSR